MVTDRNWVIPDYDTYLAVSKRYVVAVADARGCGGRGWKYTAPIYRSFGTVEVDDQLAVAR